MLIAANPTPNVMPMKYLPSRVSFKRRGGRNMRRRRAQTARERSRYERDWATVGPWRADIGPAAAVEEASRDRESATGLSQLERHWDAGDDFANRGLGLFTSGRVALGVGRQPNPVSEYRHGQAVDVVCNTVVATVEQSAGACSSR